MCKTLHFTTAIAVLTYINVKGSFNPDHILPRVIENTNCKITMRLKKRIEIEFCTYLTREKLLGMHLFSVSIPHIKLYILFFHI